VSGEPESAAWSGELEADLGLSAGLDFSALLGFESDDGGEDEEAVEGDGSSLDLADIAESFAFDGGAEAGFASATELLDVGEDLNDG
jgi:hypothetical protein